MKVKFSVISGKCIRNSEAAAKNSSLTTIPGELKYFFVEHIFSAVHY